MKNRLKALITPLLLCLAATAWTDTATFTETFSTTTYKNSTRTDADWNTSQSLLKAPWQIINNSQLNVDSARDSSGYFYYIWLDLRSGTNIYMQKYNTSGIKQWTSDVKVNVNAFSYLTGWETRPHIAIDASSNIYVTWSGYVGLTGWGMSACLQKFNTSGTRLWTSDKKVNVTYNAEYIDSEIACDSNGYVYVIFNRYGPQGAAVLLQKMNSSGARVWTADKVLFSGGKPRIAKMKSYNYFYVASGITLNSVDSNGAFRWTSSKSWGGSSMDIDVDSSNNCVCVISDNSQLYMQRVNTAGTAYWTIKVALTSTNSLKYTPTASIDSSNYVYAAWQDVPGGNWSDINIMAQKFTTSAGKTWANPVKVDGTGTDKLDSNMPVCLPDFAGGTVIGFYANRDIWANRLTSTGARSFVNDFKVNTDTNSGYYRSGGTAQSLAIDTAASNVTAATLTPTQTLNGLSVSYDLSCNGGTNWYQVTPGVKYTFPTSTPGSDLRWRAVLNTSNGSATPTVDTIAVTYEYGASGGTGIFPYRMYWDTTWSDPIVGFMGSASGTSLTCNTAYTGTTPTYGSANCTRFTYDKTKETWAGIYSLKNGWNGPGINLNGNKRMDFFAKSSINGVKVKFGVGGGTSDTASASTTVTLTTSWQEIQINLNGQNLSSMNGLWYFSISAADNTAIANPVEFFVDTVAYDEIAAP
jgi:hypothetical protein